MNQNQKAHITLREQSVVIDLNKAACWAENKDQMRRRAEREAAAAIFGAARPDILLLNGEWV